MLRPALLALLSSTLLAACGRDAEAPAAVRSSPPPPAPAPAKSVATLYPAQLPRCGDPRFAEAVQRFERSDLAGAKQLWLALPDGLDAALLGARLHAAEGDDIAAVRAIEAARAKYPDQGRVHATAAEIHAVGGRTKSAEDEIREGLALAGPSADLTRARGVLAICREGGARTGLEHLLEARATEPTLEYCDRPLAQAHVLLGNAALANQNAVEAAKHGAAALKSMPDDPDAKQLLGDALAGAGDFTAALEIYEQLYVSGARVQTTLASYSLRGATAALLEQDRALAIQRYLRARELGSTTEELGFGATVLAEEARKEVETGLAAHDSDDLPAARAAFERALRYEPDSLEAHNHLGVVLFKTSEFQAAAEQWKAVLELAHSRHVALPEPVHLNLARAWYQAGRSAEVRTVLQDYLAQEPDGEYAAETREMLERLDAEVTAKSANSARDGR